MCHADYTFMGGDGKEIGGGPEVAVGVSQMYASAFPDGVMTVKRVYSQGDTAIAELEGRGTHRGDFMGIPGTGRPVTVTICNVIELRAGKIYREREYLDSLAILTQIGATSVPGQAVRTTGR
jgi:ketosteroid isomerase-like protein